MLLGVVNVTLLTDFNIQDLPEAYSYLAPDGSEIRMVFSMQHGGVCHCRLPANHVTKAVHHKTVDEFWYFIKGSGEVWRKTDQSDVTTTVFPGICLNISVGTHFQFRNTGNEPLELLIFTMPPWPGASESVDVEGQWKSTSTESNNQ